MFYLAHLLCEEPLANNPEESAQSNFTCVVEAENVEQAQAKLRNLIFNLRKKYEMFGSATAVHLHDLIEIKKVPQEGFLARYDTRLPSEEFDSISTTLPGVSEEYCRAYTLITPEAQEWEEPTRLQPFITF